MHIVFLNPQGNFDQNDSHMTEHPDFGGQLIYVKEVSMALADMGHTVDIVTRRIQDPKWPEFDKDIDSYKGYEDILRIVRIPFGGNTFLRKELLWEHLDEFTNGILSFYGSALPDFATAHYGDGGLSGVLLKKKSGLGFSFTGHSLGAQKLDKLGMKEANYEDMEARYFFSKRIIAERLSMQYAYNIITSTRQERFEQYAHPLYKGVAEPFDERKFTIIPPGVNSRIFSTEESSVDNKVRAYISKVTAGQTKPFIIVSSRLEEKKNHKGVVEAFALSQSLQKKACLALFLRGIDNPYREAGKLPEQEQKILNYLLEDIRKHHLEDKVFFLNLQSQHELAAAYRYFAGLGSVFTLTSFYEPFGLAPIEAAACGLPAVTTKFGGPAEIFRDGKGALVDPFHHNDIARGLLNGLEEYSRYAQEQETLVKTHYTWQKTAESYFRIIEAGAGTVRDNAVEIGTLNASEQIKAYLALQ
jgi:sucrose-phosphate synthase